jgi:hypothetical protein
MIIGKSTVGEGISGSSTIGTTAIQLPTFPLCTLLHVNNQTHIIAAAKPLLDFLRNTPKDKREFFSWVREALRELEPLADTFDDPQLLEQVATIVRTAKKHAYAVGLLDIANRLPERRGKTTIDGCLRLRECLPKRKRRPDRLTPAQVAKRWGVAPATVRQWIDSGELKAIDYAKPGKRPRYQIEATALADFQRRRRTLEPQPRERRPRQSNRPINLFSSGQATTGEQTQ